MKRIKPIVLGCLFMVGVTGHTAEIAPTEVETSGTDVMFDAIKVVVKTALEGEDVVQKGLTYEHKLETARKNGETLLWLGIEVHNLKLLNEIYVSPSSFYLIDVDRISHSYESSERQIGSNIRRGEIAKGGLLFSIPTNSNPNLLRYSPGMVIKSALYPDNEISVTVAIPLRLENGRLIKDTEYWLKMNAFPEAVIRKDLSLTNTNQINQRLKKEQARLETDKKLLKWQFQQASNGIAYSQFDLGRRYLSGNGVESNRNIGLNWIRKAADQKYPEAEEFLKKIDSTEKQSSGGLRR